MYDAIVVGARCAGSPTAMLLTRKGHRVLLVDKATFPSDTLSTHILWPQGADALRRWGLFDRLAATACPPTGREVTFDLGPVVLKGGIVGTNGPSTGFGPRRMVLDKILVDAAVESGAELREAFTVEELLWDSDRVVGIRGHSRRGQTVEERARIVIGADGVNSMVAKAVQAPEYDQRGVLVCFYYSYFSGFPITDVEVCMRDNRILTMLPTHDGQALIAGGWKSSRFHEVRADIDGSIASLLKEVPSANERFQGARQEEKWTGTAGVANYFRRSHGPGWALVGDAGYDRDPITAQGISDAFIGAENLTAAIDEGLSGRRPIDEALVENETKRDVRFKAMYEFTFQLGALEPMPPNIEQVLTAVERSQAATDQYISATTGYIPLSRFMNPENIGGIMSGANVNP